jgi:colanic acid/amylovoran biosynthesis protein
MHILIDSGSYHALNLGDVAMLQAAILRLRELWPGASIAAVTNSPAALASHCPGVKPVPQAGRIAFRSDRWLGRAERLLPPRLRDRFNAFHDRIRRRWPATLAAIIGGKRMVALRRDCFAPLTYVQAVKRADLVIASGAGVFTDAFAENANGVLDTLEFAADCGVPTAAFGQGLGPVSGGALRRRMSEVLPRLALIALRERAEGLRLLDAIGVRPERVFVTGDDALEMANHGKRAEMGNALGINVRLAGYAGVAASGVDMIRTAIRRAADRLAVELIPLPIAHHPDCHDGTAISRLIADSNVPSPPVVTLATPAEVIAEVSRCRVVVTGSYHAAVFALAQGIPVVGIAATQYYVDKFAGLADLFGGGCDVVQIDAPGAGAVLEAAIVKAWADAPDLRDMLLRSADAQIHRARDAYRFIGCLVDAGALSHQRGAALRTRQQSIAPAERVNGVSRGDGDELAPYRAL